MASLTRPRGLIPGVFTAFKDNYEYDEDRHRQHFKWLVDVAQVNGFSITSGVGEFYALTFEEWKRCQEVGVEVGHGKVQVWSNFGAESYEKTIRMAEAARAAGVDGLRIINPYYAQPGPQGLYEYYRDLAKALPDISIMIYPAELSRPFPVEVVLRLSDIPNIIGLKIPPNWKVGDLVTAYTLTRDKEFTIVPSQLTLFYYFYKAGISLNASIEPLIQVAPDICRRIFTSVTRGENEEGFKATKELLLLRRGLATNMENIPSQFKYAMSLLGRPVGPVRRPLVEPTAAEKEKIKATLAGAGLLKETIASPVNS